MIGLETNRLIFRQWKKSDFPAIAAFYADETNARFVGGVKGPEEAWRLMATYIGHYTLYGYSYLAIDEKETGRLIGTVGLWDSEPWPETEMGYWLLPQGQGQGYGVEAAVAVRDYARNRLKLASLVSFIHPANEASMKLAQRAGASPAGEVELLQFGRHQVFRYW